MPAPPIPRRDLTRQANAALRAGDTERALHALVALVRAAPHDFDARLRIADGLLAAGQVRAAAEAYTAVARDASAAGHPLTTVVTLKVLAAIDPGVVALYDVLAERYAQGSPSIGRGARVSPPSPDATVPPEAWLPEGTAGATLLDAALRVATSREALPAPLPVVPPVALLSDLPKDVFARMLRAGELVRVPEGAVLLREGEPAESFFVLARGALVVTRDEGRTVLARPGVGAVLGEMALLSTAPRMATVTATEDCDVLVFGRAAIAAVAGEVHTLAAALQRFVRQRVLANLLATHPIFKPFDEAQRHALASRFETLEAPAGTVLIRQGDEGRGLYVVLVGEVSVVARGESGAHEVARLGPMEVFGEIALLRDAPTTATVTTTRDTTALLLSHALFDRLVAGVPALRAYFETLAEHRWIDTSLALSGGEEVDVLL